jgi:hypothetical protein
MYKQYNVKIKMCANCIFNKCTKTNTPVFNELTNKMQNFSYTAICSKLKMELDRTDTIPDNCPLETLSVYEICVHLDGIPENEKRKSFDIFKEDYGVEILDYISMPIASIIFMLIDKKIELPKYAEYVTGSFNYR